MLVGGTGFYIQSLLYDVDFDESNGKVSLCRETLEKEYDELGPDVMFERLKSVDPDYCACLWESLYPNKTPKLLLLFFYRFYE